MTFRRVFNSRTHRIYLVSTSGYGLAGTVQVSRTPDGLIDVDYLAPDGRSASLQGCAPDSSPQAVRLWVKHRIYNFLGRMKAPINEEEVPA